LIALTLMVVIALIGFTLHQQHKKSLENAKNQRAEMILQKVSDLNAKLDNLTNHYKKEQELLLSNMDKSIKENKSSMSKLLHSSDRVSEEIQDLKNNIQEKINHIKKDDEHKQYLTVHDLPFNVNAVDVIAGQQYVSITSNELTLPLAIGDNMSGWRLIAADFESGFAEFMNVKHQYVKVIL